MPCYYCSLIDRLDQIRVFRGNYASKFVVLMNPFTGTPQLVLTEHRMPDGRAETKEFFDAMKDVCSEVVGDAYYLRPMMKSGHFVVLSGGIGAVKICSGVDHMPLERKRV